MKVHRFVYQFRPNSSEIFVDDFEIVHQIIDVLKLKIDEEIVLTDGNGREVKGKIIVKERKGITIKVLENKLHSAPFHTVTLYAALLKADHFELLAQKATETGVTRIVPLITERTIKLNIKQDRVEKIIREAVELSGRLFLPLLEEPMKLKEALEDAKNNSRNFLFDFGGGKINSQNLKGSIGAFVGPEGGWSEAEREMVENQGFEIVSLSPFTFRGETAGIIATYLLVNE